MLLYKSNLNGNGVASGNPYGTLADNILYIGAGKVSQHFSPATFNENIIIGNSINMTDSMLSGCSAFNKIVNIPSSVISTRSMFERCSTFNCPVILPPNLIDASNMFSSCGEYDSPISIPNNVRNTSYMFNSCSKYNQQTIIPNSVIDSSSMFAYCYEFDNTVTIGENVINARYMFRNCNSFNQDVVFPANCQDLYGALSNATNFGKNIYVKGTGTKNVSTLLWRSNNSLRKNIHFNIALNSYFNSRTPYSTAVTWTTMDNGYYNTAINVYCYYNYSG